MPISKAFLQYLNRYPQCRQIVIDPDQGWLEPTHSASEMLYIDPIHFCEALSEQLGQLRTQNVDGLQRTETGWLHHFQNLNQLAQQQVLSESLKLDSNEHMSEGRVFIELMQVLPPHCTLFVGNSMPVRDLDTFFMKQDRTLRVLANRGANGIDGIVSSALGVSAVSEPLVLVLGDLSFYHDLNGLLAAKLHQLNCTIIVINNDGGGIFSFLPQANHPKHFEKLFGTPIDLDFAGVVEMYGGSFVRACDWESFRRAVSDGIESGGLKVVEVRSERAYNLKLHRDIWDAANQVTSSYLMQHLKDDHEDGN
jgi:2-succinyl-5-enolpyruvyl-6-hydroxy-3-cyclohexene-1-carboxylate synthase